MKICAKLTVLYIVCYNKKARNVSLSRLFPPIYKCNLSYSGDFFSTVLGQTDSILSKHLEQCLQAIFPVLFFFFCQGTYQGKEENDHVLRQQSRCSVDSTRFPSTTSFGMTWENFTFSSKLK